ncbi:glycine betaine ABC transporter substrate-binding protein [Pseudalkalibacillus berkeleyi]|uniref:Glycine/betaine ABC transporter substrate-binding protein n=1 Tax=Pseudalkalibacillus berkeleyi TaxID=1069813 RepID=A0ABS9GX79_9BACL|nr:glycine betaine ABC transporter substrate-binding protein [Pseudalkalibacillus berkeleyi]MCF6136205.1 glycine/betaine ABC transporter substrate-binding protein [Pseudalkalibacillus berkeleyi]
MLKKIVIPFFMLILIVAGCGGNGDSGDKLVISGKKWTEQYILPHLLAEYIKGNTDYEVEVKEALGEVDVLTKAMEGGDIDMYVEYSGTGYLAVLKEEYNPDQTAEDIYEATKKGYKKEKGIVWLPPLGFENNYALAMTEETYKDLGVKTTSELAAKSDGLIIGAPPEFYERPDGMDPFVKKYDLSFKKEESLDPNLMYRAVKDGEVDVITAFTTDGRIPRFNLKTVEDDKNFFPPYYAAPIIRQEALDKFPDVEKVMKELEGKISSEDMAKMNAKVDIDNEDPKQVAIDFLKEKGLID